MPTLTDALCQVTLYENVRSLIDGGESHHRRGYPCGRPVAAGSMKGLCDKHEADRVRLS